MDQNITFYFDFSSTYAYVAQSRIAALAARHGMGVLWRPFLLGAVMKAHGTEAPGGAGPKTDYMIMDVERIANLAGLRFTLPPRFPFSSVQPARAFYWIDRDDPQAAKAFAMAVFRATFGEGRDISTVEGVIEIGAELGYAEAALRAALADEMIKARLRAETDKAIEQGVFGSPTFLLDGKMYWGQDRLSLLEHHIESRQ